jgi:hypothetical protein
MSEPKRCGIAPALAIVKLFAMKLLLVLVLHVLELGERRASISWIPTRFSLAQPS